MADAQLGMKVSNRIVFELSGLEFCVNDSCLTTNFLIKEFFVVFNLNVIHFDF